MRHAIEITCVLAMAIAACDSEPCQVWGTSPVIRENGPPVGAILALADGMVTGDELSSGMVHRLDADGDTLWTVPLATADMDVGVTDWAVDTNGNLVVVAERFIHEGPEQAPGAHLWVGSFSAAGEPRWEVRLGAARGWQPGEVRIHPSGDSIVSWVDSHDQFGGTSELLLTRIDPEGNVVWSSSVAVEGREDAQIGGHESQSAMDLLPDGSILQLSGDGLLLRLVHTDADGTPISDVTIEDVLGQPMDLVVRPDGSAWAVANNQYGPMLLELELDGSRPAKHEFTIGFDPFFEALAWDPVHEVFYVGGTADLEASGGQRPWTLIIDGEGVELASVFERYGTSGSINDAVARPEGGFAVVRREEIDLVSQRLVEIVAPCGEL
jgi:hypothetical protein